jgi:hypothetical protein
MWVDADRFSEFFTRHRPGVVMLQACESGALSAAQAFVGVASRVVQHNIPVVVAMQYEVSNTTASRFAQCFYKKLAVGEPVDIAAQEGRRAIAQGPAQYQKRDFATPVIFMRVQDGYLFTRQETLKPLPTLILSDKDDITFIISGIQVLIDLIFREPSILHSANTFNKEIFESTYYHINKLNLYKSLHDKLHLIEDRCLQPIRRESPKRLLSFKVDFVAAQHKIQDLLKSWTVNPIVKETLVEQLKLTSDAFDEADKNNEINANENVVCELQALIREGLPALDPHISDAAGELKLDPLINLMELIQDGHSQLVSEQDSIRTLIEGVNALKRVRDELRMRVNEHTRLQILDTKLRTICESSVSSANVDVNNISKDWKRIKNMIAQLEQPFSKELEESREAFVSTESRIDEFLLDNNDKEILAELDEYFRLVVKAFIRVDTGLKDFSDQLNKINPKVNELIQAMQKMLGIP